MKAYKIIQRGKKNQKTKNYNHTFLILIYGRILDVAVYIRDVN